jgi:hypothetical protein
MKREYKTCFILFGLCKDHKRNIHLNLKVRDDGVLLKQQTLWTCFSP